MRFTAFLLALQTAVALSVAAQEGPGPATVLRIVNRIEFKGNTVVSSEDLLKAIPIKPGDLLTTAKLERAISAIEQAYKDRGYPAVVADDILAGFQETGTLTLPIIEVRVAEVRIEGLHKTREFVVRRILELRPGELYSRAALQRDAGRLDALRIFESIEATIEPAPQPGRVIVVWRLAEVKKTGYVSFGGSYGQSGGLVGSVSLTESNLRGRAEKLRFTFSIGSIDARTSWRLDYLNPWIARETSLGLGAFDAVQYRFSRDLVPSLGLGRYFERRLGGRIGVSKTLSIVRQLSVGPRYEDVKVSNLPLQLFVPSLLSANGKVAALSGELVTDRRNSLIYPSQGYIWRAFVEPAHVDLQEGGGNWFAKGSAELRRFFPLSKTSASPQEKPARQSLPRVLALRLQGGTSAGKLPFFEQYFLGGMGGLRGYLEDRFWGKHMVLASSEFRQPIARNLAAIAFVDTGDAWGSDFQFLPVVETDYRQHEGFSPHVGAGVGIRYVGRFGLFGLDFAWGERFRIHLAIGETF